MDVQIFTLCDYAARDDRNKLNIIGTFDKLYSEFLPFTTQQRYSIASRITFSKSEGTKYTLEVNIIDGNGQKIIQSINGNIDCIFQKNETKTSFSFVICLPPITFVKFGEYAIRMSVANKLVKDFSFWVEAFKK